MKLTLTVVLVLGLFGCNESSNNDLFSPRNRCDDECARFNNFDDCITAAEIADCKDACLTVSPQVAETFADCVDSADPFTCPGKLDCLRTNLMVDGSSGTNNANNANNMTGDAVGTCKTNCDHIASECGDSSASTTADCKASCDTSAADTLDSFNACVDASYYICSDGSLQACYDHLGVF